MPHEEGIIKIRDGKTLTITRDDTKGKKYFSTAPYQRIGKHGKTRFMVKGMDMTEIFLGLSRAGTWMFWSLAKVRNERTNIAVFKSSDLTPVERKRASTGYKELNKLEVLVRTKQNHYLINPRALLPESRDFENVRSNWETNYK